MVPATRKRIALYYPNFSGGGAEAVALWILEALKDRHDLLLFSALPVNLRKLDTMYGTSLADSNVEVRSLCPEALVPLADFAIANLGSGRARMLSIHWTLRFLKAARSDYDLAISGYNAVDLGDPGIQYIHYTGVVDNVVEKWKLYGKISDFDCDRMCRNVSLANSEFVAGLVEEKYKVPARVVYPPVVVDAMEIPWQERGDEFICSGRLVKTKQPHKAIQILSLVRKRGHDVKLHITGGGGSSYAWRYTRTLHKMVRENADWVTLHKGLSYKDYVKVLSRCRYGIHHKPEPFGISIAEMVKVGLIPFVRPQGGQIEIVGAHNEALQFNGVEQAAEKILSVLEDDTLRDRLREDLRQRKELFSTDRFKSEIQQVVEEFWQGGGE